MVKIISFFFPTRQVWRYTSMPSSVSIRVKLSMFWGRPVITDDVTGFPQHPLAFGNCTVRA